MSGEQFIASHVKGIGSSGIRRMFDLGATLKDPINLSIGQPDFPVPAAARQAMIQAIEDGHTGYTVTRGIAPLRERIAKAIKDEFDWEPDLFVTSGLSGGLLLALMACLDPGDEVIFPDPYFVSYKQLVPLVGGRSVIVDLYDSKFQLDADRIEAAVTDRTKILLLNSPSNPTGVVYGKANVEAVCEVARKHDLLILSDEIYDMLCYDERSPSPARFAPERTVLLRGFGKSYAMTGLRMGYAAGPPAVIAEMAKLQQYTFVCAPHPVQYGALAAMDTDMSSCVSAYRAKRDLVCDALEGAVEFVRPGGGFFVFPKTPPTFPSTNAFVEETIKRNVLIIPGEVFSERNTHFRVSYAAPDEKLQAGCKIIRELARG